MTTDRPTTAAGRALLAAANAVAELASRQESLVDAILAIETEAAGATSELWQRFANAACVAIHSDSRAGTSVDRAHSDLFHDCDRWPCCEYVRLAGDLHVLKVSV